MSTIFDDDILIHHVMVPGLDGDGFTKPEATVLRSDVDTLLSRPIITELNDIPDVDTASASDGDALVFKSSSGNWETSPPTQVSGQSGNNDTRFGPVQVFNFFRGIKAEAVPGSPEVAQIEPVYGGTGSAFTVARGDHYHWVPGTTVIDIAPQAYMSGGSRTFVSTTIALPDRHECLIEVDLNVQMRGGDPGASYFTFGINIDGSVRTSGTGANGMWCVQGVPRDTRWKHSRLTSNVNRTVNVSAWVEWNGGGGFYTDRGDLEIRVSTAR